MKQADDLLPRLQAFGAQEHVFFMNDRLQQEEVKVAGWDAKIKGSIEYFRKLRKDGLDVRKPIPSALRKLDKDKETLKGLLEKLQESGGDLNSIRTALDDAQLSEVEENFKNSFAIGFDYETGGHVFQVMISNAQGPYELTFIENANGDISASRLYLGFNISRAFSLKGKDSSSW